MFGPLEQFEIVTLFYNFYTIKLDVSSVFVKLHNWISLVFLSCPENVNLDTPFYLPFNIAFVFLLHYGLAANESFLHEGLPVVINFIFLFFNNFILSFWFFFFIIFFFAYQIFFQNNIILKIWLFCFQQFCQFIQQIINNLLINFKGKFYFFFLLFCLFFFLSFLNLLGLIPYSFAITSYFSITFLFAFIFFLLSFFLVFIITV